MILTPVDEHGNPIGPTVGGHSIEGLRAELAAIPAMDTEALRRLAEEFGREIRAAEARMQEERRARWGVPRIEYGMGQLRTLLFDSPPPRPYPSVVVGAAMAGWVDAG